MFVRSKGTQISQFQISQNHTSLHMYECKSYFDLVTIHNTSANA